MRGIRDSHMSDKQTTRLAEGPKGGECCKNNTAPTAPDVSKCLLTQMASGLETSLSTHTTLHKTNNNHYPYTNSSSQNIKFVLDFIKTLSIVCTAHGNA